MKTVLYIIAAVFISANALAQNLQQTVRGKVVDTETQMALIGVQISVIGTDPLVGTISDAQGHFRLENIPVGRISLQCSYIGYEALVLPDIQVVSGRESVLNIGMQESIAKMDVVEISGTSNKGEALNEMALVSSLSLSSEETTRYAGGFNDPARILSNFAGVNNSQDGSADIIVRGNAPKYLQWRLEGVQITNPSHFADPAGTGTNGVSTLNNNILATSDFYTGAFPAEYGDALSGVYDVKLRTGNSEKFEAILGAGLIGTDVTLEGPFKKGYNGSFLVNYRFTTVALADQLGLLPDLGGIPSFQDGAFKIMLPSDKLGTFSIYGLAGSSNISFEDVSPSIWQTPGDQNTLEGLQEDFSKDAYLLNTGINHSLPISKNSYLKTTLAFSTEGIEDKVFETLKNDETVVYARDNFSSQIRNNTYRANMTYHHKLSARNSFQAGTKYALKRQQFDISRLQGDPSERFSLVDFEEGIGSIRNFVSWKHRLEGLTFVLGLHNMNVLYNNKSTLEPRFAANWKPAPGHSVNFGYGKHSTMESIHNYFARTPLAEGGFEEPNVDLDLLKAHHFVLGYEKRFSQNLRAKVEVYYQSLYNLPVENDINSSYATINETLDIRYLDLVNEGTGTNYGVELTLERFFNKNFYYMLNASLFESTYKALDGVERNTAFNSNYLVNMLMGKEFTNLGKKKNQTLSLNTKVFVGGGRRIVPLLRDAQGNIDVDTEVGQYWDYDKAYDNYLDDIYTITLSMNYKWEKPKRTHEFFLNIDNITNNKPRLSEYYDPAAEGSVGYLTPLGMFPNIMYRVYF